MPWPFQHFIPGSFAVATCRLMASNQFEPFRSDSVSLKITTSQVKGPENIGVSSSVLTEGRAAVDTGQVAKAAKVTLCGTNSIN